MAQNNIGSLVVLKPGDHHQIAGIITERGMISAASFSFPFQELILQKMSQNKQN